ncbi:hypothetical protein pb186bvf_007229 [Paramecium bursaria]
MKKLPAVVSDIDGVIVRGKQIIKGSDYVVNSILQKPSIPFYLLTNGGGQLEQEKAIGLNKILKSNFQKEQVILNFTPLRQIMGEYRDRLSLICGAGKTIEIAEDSGLKQFITINELQALKNRYNFKTYRQSKINEIKETLIQRCVNIDKKFEAVFIVYDPIEWENDIQQIVDILKVDIKTPYLYVFWLPRFAFGLFTASLKSICKQRLGQEPNIIYYGKPSTNTFKYVESLIHQSNPNVGNIYMIGDNPKSDIRGANDIGWISILVRSGIFKGVNDPLDPAQYVVCIQDYTYRLMICLKHIN